VRERGSTCCVSCWSKETAVMSTKKSLWCVLEIAIFLSHYLHTWYLIVSYSTHTFVDMYGIMSTSASLLEKSPFNEWVRRFGSILMSLWSAFLVRWVRFVLFTRTNKIDITKRTTLPTYVVFIVY
jgi:hypothetical protein